MFDYSERGDFNPLRMQESKHTWQRQREQRQNNQSTFEIRQQPNHQNKEGAYELLDLVPRTFSLCHPPHREKPWNEVASF